MTMNTPLYLRTGGNYIEATAATVTNNGTATVINMTPI